MLSGLYRYTTLGWTVSILIFLLHILPLVPAAAISTKVRTWMRQYYYTLEHLPYGWVLRVTRLPHPIIARDFNSADDITKFVKSYMETAFQAKHSEDDDNNKEFMRFGKKTDKNGKRQKMIAFVRLLTKNGHRWPKMISKGKATVRVTEKSEDNNNSSTQITSESQLEHNSKTTIATITITPTGDSEKS